MSNLAAFLQVAVLMAVISTFLRKYIARADKDLVRIPVRMETAMPPRRIPVKYRKW
jgi:hypothetical protein